MVVRLVQPTEYEQVYALREYAFRRHYEGDILEDYKFWVKKSQVVGDFTPEGQLKGQLMLMPLNMTIADQNLPMGGVGYVATYPEYRNQGVMKNIITAALKQMKADHQTISALGPFSVSFYRHFGWEIFFDRIDYTIDQVRYPEPQGADEATVERTTLKRLYEDEAQLAALNDYYNATEGQKNGMMLRDRDWWLRLLRTEGDAAVAIFRLKGKIAGFVRYQRQDLVFAIQDFSATTRAIANQIWRYLSSHKSNVFSFKGQTAISNHFDLGFADPQFEKQIVQNIMVRIVDAVPFLQQTLANRVKTPLYLQLDDSFAPWNEATYRIADGEVMAGAKVAEEQVLHLPINLASALMVGYIDLETALGYAPQPLRADAKAAWQQSLAHLTLPQLYEDF